MELQCQGGRPQGPSATLPGATRRVATRGCFTAFGLHPRRCRQCVMLERVKAFRGINGLRPTRWAGPLHLFHGTLTEAAVVRVQRTTRKLAMQLDLPTTPWEGKDVEPIPTIRKLYVLPGHSRSDSCDISVVPHKVAQSEAHRRMSASRVI